MERERPADDGLPDGAGSATAETPATADALALDANALAGLLQQIFGADMTARPCRCAHCGNEAEVGTLIAYTHAPGAVLRCSVCAHVVMRIARTPLATYVDLRGAAAIRLPPID